MKSSLLHRITIDPNVCHGKPCIRGLRYPVESILEYLASGMSYEEILIEFDDLEVEDLYACQLFAARSLWVLTSSPEVLEAFDVRSQLMESLSELRLARAGKLSLIPADDGLKSL